MGKSTENIQLFCLPYAGGAASFYKKWANYLDPRIDLCPIEYAGRGERYKDPLYENFDDALYDVSKIINKMRYTDNYALFGHSLGSYLIYELAFHLKESKETMPKHLFFSGANFPRNLKHNFLMHKLPDDKFIEKIIEYGALPDILLQKEKMIKPFIPIMKNDCKVLETYSIAEKKSKLDCNITILTGSSDQSVPVSQIDEWKDCCKGTYERYIFDGGHFFIIKYFENIVKIIDDSLKILF